MRHPILEAATPPPVVGSQEMRRLDYWAEKEYHMPLMVMTENAGRDLAELLLRRFHPARSDPILVLAGKGGNGAGALAAARHLRHRGYQVQGLTTVPATKMGDDAKRHLAMFRKDGGSCPDHRPGQPLPPADYILDGVIGYGLRDAPSGSAAGLIRAANATQATIVAMDLPSGLDPDRGTAAADTIRAKATMAIAFPKPGLLLKSAASYVGELYLADVAFPRALYEEFETTPEQIFGDDVLVRLPDGAADG